MGLQLRLPKESNNLYFDFDNAYWYLTELGYDTDNCYFCLTAFPTREIRLAQGTLLPENPLPIGGVASNCVKADIYRWRGIFPTADIFPNGIPLDSNVQKTYVYNFIKAYTGLPWADVFEH